LLHDEGFAVFDGAASAVGSNDAGLT
jgi:hypothetical protein